MRLILHVKNFRQKFYYIWQQMQNVGLVICPSYNRLLEKYKFFLSHVGLNNLRFYTTQPDTDLYWLNVSCSVSVYSAAFANTQCT